MLSEREKCEIMQYAPFCATWHGRGWRSASELWEGKPSKEWGLTNIRVGVLLGRQCGFRFLENLAQRSRVVHVTGKRWFAWQDRGYAGQPTGCAQTLL